MTTDQYTSALEITSPVDALLEAIAKVMSVVPVKSPKPVMTNVKFSVVNGQLELSGSDVSSGIYYSIPAATITSEGVGIIGGVTIFDYFKEFRGSDVTISFNARGGCRFKSSGGDFKIVGDDPRDYPHTVRFDHNPGIQISGADLVDMVKKSAFAVDGEESRLSTTGVLFEHKSGRFRLVATDKKRMTINERAVESSSADFSAIVPPSFLKSLLKVVSKDVSSDQVTVGVDSNRIFFRLSRATIYGSILEGKFPPYEEALRIVLKESIDCGVSTLLSTIRRACLVDKTLCAFNFTNGAMQLKFTNAGVGTGSSEMPILYQGPDVRVGLNPTFVREGLEAMTSKRCRFMFQGPRNAGVLKEIHTNQDGSESPSDRFVYAVLPVILPRDLQDK